MDTNTPQTPLETDRRKVTDHEEYFNGLFPETPVYVSMMQGTCSSNPDEMLITTAGTGIAVCINDKALKIGGLAHLLLPNALRNDANALIAKTEDTLDSIIQPLIEAGSTSENLKAKVFGGSQLSENLSQNDGLQTYALIKNHLSNRGIQISIEETGKNVGRRIHFFPKNGKAVRRLLQRQVDRDVLIEREDTFNQNFSL